MDKPRKVEEPSIALRRIYADHFARVEEDARRRRQIARRRSSLEDRPRSRVA